MLLMCVHVCANERDRYQSDCSLNRKSIIHLIIHFIYKKYFPFGKSSSVTIRNI